MDNTSTSNIANYAPTLNESTTTGPTDPSSTIEKQYFNDESYPDGGLRAWLVVLGSFFLLFAAFGFQTSIGLFQLYWSLNQLQDWSPGRIAWIPSVFIFLSLALSVQASAIFDRYGARYILLAGSVGYFLTFILLAQCTTYLHFMLCLGILGGVSSASLITVSQGVISHWFKKRRGQASGLAMLGSSFGGIVFPLLLRLLLENHGWAWSMRILGLIVFLCLIIGNLFCHSRLLATPTSAVVNVRCYLDSTFNWLIISVFGELGHIVHMG
jgi:MFS family permease